MHPSFAISLPLRQPRPLAAAGGAGRRRPPPRASLHVAPIPRVWGPDSDPPVAGAALIDSPLLRRDSHFVDGEAVLSRVVLGADEVRAGGGGAADSGGGGGRAKAYLRAGPRRRVFFRSDARAAVVTCGGIAPGLATVVREIVMCLCREYGLGSVFGVRYGWRGFYERSWTKLTPEDVAGLHRQGGSPLGSSRGGFDLTRIVDAIETRQMQIVICIGGDGTMIATQKVFEEVRRRGLQIAVVHVPKTVDKDIPLLSTTFGFDTAVEEAQRSINAASVEATSFPDCVSIVKLMGRNSGFIAAYSTLASRDVDCCLIPEVPFALHGPGGVLEYVESVLDRQGKCVVVVAEGAGGELVGDAADIGLHIYAAVKAHFKERRGNFSHKYIDPTYVVRAGAAIASDNILCTLLAHAAVHGAMAGMTGCVVGQVHNHNCVIPISELAGIQAKLDPVRSPLRCFRHGPAEFNRLVLRFWL
jgi:6-phosphofructokinase 1